MSDWLPVVSQAKSLFQWLSGDEEGARQTQNNFSKQCPVVSQIRSAVELITGDTESALNTQKECVRTLSGMVDGVPVVGHVKGVIHYAFGDREGGDNAMKSASRTSGALAGGAGGLLIGGPPGAVAGGITGALTIDGITTGIDSAVHDEFRPAGYFHQVKNLVKDPTNPGTWFDTSFMVVGDGLSGNAGGNLAKNFQKVAQERNVRQRFDHKRQLNVDQYSKASDILRDRRNGVAVRRSVVSDLETNRVIEGQGKQLRTRVPIERRGYESHSNLRHHTSNACNTRVTSRFTAYHGEGSLYRRQQLEDNSDSEYSTAEEGDN